MSRKPPVVLIHGACSQPAHFEAWREQFSKAGYRVVVPPLPGHAPVERDVEIWQEFIGHTDAVDTVEVRSRVPGFLEEVGFEDATVYWEGADEDGDGNGVFRPAKRRTPERGWIAYISGVRR